ncbi:iron chaperone [Lentzea chajnantorensis]
MVQSKAATVDEYLDELTAEQRAEITAVRDVVVAHLPAGYAEGVLWGMITWYVPIEVSGPTYNGQPLSYVALAAQKRHCSLYLTTAMAPGESFRERYVATGKKLDMGKSCVRFTRAADLALDVIGDEIARYPVAEFVDHVQRVTVKR